MCRITSRPPKYPGEIAIPEGHAGQTRDGLILAHQVRTIDLRRITTFQLGGVIQYVTSRDVRLGVRAALAHHLGLDIPSVADGAA